MNTKICTKCNIEKPLKEFSPRKDGFLGRASRCIVCRREDRRQFYKDYDNKRRRNRWKTDAAHRVSCTKAAKKYREVHKDTLKERQKARRKRIKLKVFEIYGGKCSCCGECRFEFLAVDHVNGGGNKERQTLSTNKLYLLLSQSEKQDKYQLLCHNCNMSKGFYGYCPHSVDKTDMVL